MNMYARFTVLNQNPTILLTSSKSSKEPIGDSIMGLPSFILHPSFPSSLPLGSTCPTRLSASGGRNYVLFSQCQAQGMASSSCSAKGRDGFSVKEYLLND